MVNVRIVREHGHFQEADAARVAEDGSCARWGEGGDCERGGDPSGWLDRSNGTVRAAWWRGGVWRDGRGRDCGGSERKGRSAEYTERHVVAAESGGEGGGERADHRGNEVGVRHVLLLLLWRASTWSAQPSGGQCGSREPDNVQADH